MKKAIVVILLLIGAIGIKAAPVFNKALTDSIMHDDRKHPQTGIPDTTFLPNIPHNPLLSYQNIVYKRRLDTLQNAVPLTYNEHVQEYIDLYVNKRKGQVGKMLGLSKYYFPIFERALKEIGIPDEIKYISIIESALNPHAVSRSGAVGPWQFMYTTAKGYGLIMDNFVDERKDPAHASYAAARYLRDAYEQLGDWLLAIAAYNCGTGAVSRAIARSGGESDFWKVRPFLPRETQNYVPAFIATAYAMNYYLKHDIVPQPVDFNILTDVLEVNRTVSLAAIAKAANIELSELRFLNPSYKKQVVNGSLASPKRLVIPNVDRQMYASLYEVLNSSQAPEVIAVSTYSGADTRPESHRVKSGQTLGSIANLYGVEVQDLKVWNNLKSSSIVPGQVLRLQTAKPAQQSNSASSYFTYIVKAGDTLSAIAEKFKGATVSKIKALNNLAGAALQPGMKLKINRG